MAVLAAGLTVTALQLARAEEPVQPVPAATSSAPGAIEQPLAAEQPEVDDEQLPTAQESDSADPQVDDAG
ncbi:MAG: hypothetical protein VB093_10150, partial [Propionicimonas sp.]|nr:hypothetical protein [Propionicimonas sp.]